MLVAQKELEVRHQLLERLSEARVRTDEIFDLVRPDSLYERPIPERHRIIFYLGHLEAFDWNLLRERVLGQKTFAPDLDKLFAFGIDPVNGALPSDQPRDWPPAADARQYVKRIRESIDAGLETLESADWDSSPVGADFTTKTLLNVAIEHRLMHAETLAYMLHQLPLDRKVRMQRKPELMLPPIAPRMIEIPAGQATLGLSRRDQNSFGWDNEYEAQTVDVPAFTIDKYKVTNGQFLDFVAAGGYENPACWREEDWNWRTARDIRHPVFWSRNRDRWYCRTMFDEIPLPLDWPVYVSKAEANAYARWAGKSLPTEAQWHRAAYGTERGPERKLSLGRCSSKSKPGQFRFPKLGPNPGRRFPRRPERIRRSGFAGQWVGVDINPVRTVSRLSAVFVLSRLLRRLLRRQALRNERSFAAHGSLHAASLVSQLVPAALPVRLRRISLRELTDRFRRTEC